MEPKAEEAIGVADLARRLRRAVEGATGREWVEGEVTSLRIAASGHVYFTLKDEREEAAIDCVIYRVNAVRARRFVTDGARVQLLGRATFWAPRGRLQLVGEAARPAGKGALLAALEALREKLQAEGLFRVERKRKLPAEPRVVGVVTSASGAALHDIVTVAFRRGPVRLVLSRALVQGEGAPASLLAALDRIERLAGLDVLIIGRGGGAAEDLMAFNDERVVRRVASFLVPVVSAVGHEIDTTLTDWAADVRAATPSQAAELVIPSVIDQRTALLGVRRALGRAMHARLLEDSHLLAGLRGKLTDPRFVIAEKQQHLDDLRMRLDRRVERVLARRRSVQEGLAARLRARHPATVVVQNRAEVRLLTERLGSALRLRLEGGGGRLREAAGRLEALSPLAVLSRGYAIATRPDGVALRAASDARPGDSLRLRLHQGSLDARVERVRSEIEEPP